MNRGRLIIIGAGPMGLAAALSASDHGWDVTVLERRQVGESLRRWGPTRFFSPLSMNLPPRAREILAHALPPDDAILTGPEFAEGILQPLAASPQLNGRVLTRHTVIAVGRRGLTRMEMAGHPIRAERHFRLLVETPHGEQAFEADRVLDASGTYGNPLHAGTGGIPARGERALNPHIIRDLGCLHTHLPGLHNSRVFLTGHGHSAANAILQLAQAGAQVTWAVRTPNRRPCVAVPDDPLPERRRVVDEANLLAMHPPCWLRMERRVSIESFEDGSPAGIIVKMSGGRSVTVDHIVALTGYRPDLSFLSELSLEIAPDTEGAGRLAKALSNITDCLSLPKLSPTDLDSGEPGFHMIGAKSYGRARTFLLQNGYAQLETVLDRLAFSE